MTYDIKVEWKEFKIHLPDLESWMRANAGSDYVGNSADINLRLHFLNEPSQEIKDAIQNHIDSLTVEEESEKIMQYIQREAAVHAAEAAIPESDLMTLNTAEKKLFMGRVLTDADKDTLVEKYWASVSGV